MSEMDQIMQNRVQAGLIAAGTGSRFRKAGFSIPKPMIEVGGKPLMGWALSQFRQAGMDRLAAIFNSTNCLVCSDYIKEEFPEFEADIRCADTDSSAASFMDVLSRATSDYVLITTTDSIYAPGALLSLLEFADKIEENAIVLGVTEFVDDEKPLYANIGERHEITTLGEEPSRFVTNGVYLMPSDTYKMGKGLSFPALRKFLAYLIESGVSCYGFDMAKSVDVDRPEDIAVAEEFLNQCTKNKEI